MYWILLFACASDLELDKRLDQDEDGYNAAESAGDDCDDGNPSINPGALERCDDVDNDCDGVVDDNPSDGTTWYIDADDDGFGTDPITACARPPNAVSAAGDCDDTQSSTHPSANEICNGLDDDCDGAADEGLTTFTYFQDSDGDGFGSELETQSGCAPPEGFVEADGDCDDTDASVHPNAEEVFYDGVDQDCAGDSDFDADGDGFDFTTDDCDDQEPQIHPDATEVCNNGVDDDCADDDSVCGLSGQSTWTDSATGSINIPTRVIENIHTAPPDSNDRSTVVTNGDGWQRWKLGPNEASLELVSEGDQEQQGFVHGDPTTDSLFGSDNLGEGICGLTISDATIEQGSCVQDSALSSLGPTTWADTGHYWATDSAGFIYRVPLGSSGKTDNLGLTQHAVPTPGGPHRLAQAVHSGAPRLYATYGSADGVDIYASDASGPLNWSLIGTAPMGSMTTNFTAVPADTTGGDSVALFAAVSDTHTLRIHRFDESSDELSWAEPWIAIEDVTSFNVQLAALDLNGDGNLDFAVMADTGTDQSQLHIYLGPLPTTSPVGEPDAMLTTERTYPLSMGVISGVTRDHLVLARPATSGSELLLLPFGLQ